MPYHGHRFRLSSGPARHPPYGTRSEICGEMDPHLPQPNRRLGRPLWAWLLALAGVTALLILAFLRDGTGKQPSRDGTDEQPSADCRPLIVWIANNDRTGVAVAFNELKDAYRQNLEYHLRDGPCWRP